MNTCTDYQILHKESTEELAREVRERLQFGWQPIGGVQIVANPHNGKILRCYQAMVAPQKQSALHER